MNAVAKIPELLQVVIGFLNVADLAVACIQWRALLTSIARLLNINADIHTVRKALRNLESVNSAGTQAFALPLANTGITVSVPLILTKDTGQFVVSRGGGSLSLVDGKVCRSGHLGKKLCFYRLVQDERYRSDMGYNENLKEDQVRTVELYCENVYDRSMGIVSFTILPCGVSGTLDCSIFTIPTGQTPCIRHYCK